MTLLERLLSKIKVLESGCWQYTGGINTAGYGNIWDNGKTRGAHIVAYELLVGPVHPIGINVCHNCDNKWCINPEHLFLGTQLDNIHDMIVKGRDGFRGTRNGRALLDLEKVNEIKNLLGVLTQEQIADQYGVSEATISAISTGRNWS